MTIPLHVLIIDNNAEDADLMILHLTEAGFRPDWRRVETEADYLSALEPPPDLILSDWQLARFSGLRALQLMGEHGLDLPFIIVSGTIGEEFAIQALRAGAYDCVLKNRLTRLGQVAQRALTDKRHRQERQQAEQAMRESEERYREIFNGVQDAIFVETIDGKILAANDRACAMYGYSHAEFLVKVVADLVPAGQPILLSDTIEGSPAPLETFNLRANGESFPIEISGRLQVIGGIELMLVIVRDITERKRAEEQLRLQSAALEAAANAIFITDRAGKIQWANPAFSALTGYSAAEALGQTPSLLKSGRQDQAFYKEMWKTILAGRVWHGEIVNRRKDGGLYTEDATITPLMDTRGQVTHFVAIKQDISERKQRERELEASAAFSIALRGATTRAEMPAIILDSLISLLDVDGARLQMLNPASGVLVTELGRGVWTQATGALGPPGRGLGAHVLATGQPYLNNDVAHDPHLLRPDLLIGCRAVAGTALLTHDQVIGLLWIGSRRLLNEHDLQLLTSIAEIAANAIQRESLLEEIAAQARQIQQIMDTVPEGVLLLDDEGRMLMVNPAAARDLNLLAEHGRGDRLTHLGGRSLLELLSPPPPEGYHELQAHDRAFHLIARPIAHQNESEEGPTARHWVLVINDVTQAQERQRYQQAQERLATIGQMAAGIAHDFNNILGAIAIFAEMLHNSPGFSDRQRHYLDTIRVQTDRAAALIHQVLDFSRRSVVQRAPVDLLPLVKELIKLLERTLPENIRLKIAYDRNQYAIYADLTQMQQVLMNLALNARDAMPTGGQLTFALSHLTVAPDKPPPLPDMGAGDWVLVSVTDTGMGIAPEHMAHIFEPFFTTKGPGKGTGLGLAQVYGIVKQHDGAVDVSSRVMKGTTCMVCLPLLAAPMPMESPRSAHEAPHGDGETILLVEDNPALQAASAELLEELNYRVLRANNGSEALTVLAAHHETVALVLSDVIMPEMGGLELYAQMQQHYPQINFLFMTGHTLEADFSTALLGAVADWIQKPFSIDTLTAKISEALAR